jgi:ABC-type bacteriocin/lantibiotic exporter with double-glycine peptidase domain
MLKLDIIASSLVMAMLSWLVADVVYSRLHVAAESEILGSIGSSFRRDFESPCGVVVTSVATNLVGHPIKLSDAKAIVPVDTAGRTSMAELSDIVNNSGLFSRGVRLDRLDQLPCGAVLICRVKESHWVVVTKNNQGMLVVLDPPNSSISVSPRRFAEIWDGNALLIADSIERLTIQLRALGIVATEKGGS